MLLCPVAASIRIEVSECRIPRLRRGVGYSPQEYAQAWDVFVGGGGAGRTRCLSCIQANDFAGALRFVRLIEFFGIVDPCRCSGEGLLDGSLFPEHRSGCRVKLDFCDYA
jgi:hypothetical protein